MLVAFFWAQSEPNNSLSLLSKESTDEQKIIQESHQFEERSNESADYVFQTNKIQKKKKFQTKMSKKTFYHMFFSFCGSSSFLTVLFYMFCTYLLFTPAMLVGTLGIDLSGIVVGLIQQVFDTQKSIFNLKNLIIRIALCICFFIPAYSLEKRFIIPRVKAILLNHYEKYFNNMIDRFYSEETFELSPEQIDVFASHLKSGLSEFGFCVFYRTILCFTFLSISLFCTTLEIKRKNSIEAEDVQLNLKLLTFLLTAVSRTMPLITQDENKLRIQRSLAINLLLLGGLILSLVCFWVVFTARSVTQKEEDKFKQLFNSLTSSFETFISCNLIDKALNKLQESNTEINTISWSEAISYFLPAVIIFGFILFLRSINEENPVANHMIALLTDFGFVYSLFYLIYNFLQLRQIAEKINVPVYYFSRIALPPTAKFKKLTSRIEKIIMTNVSAGYDGTEILYIENLQISTDIPVRLMGESGSGKTTLINLITHDKKPLSGDIQFILADGNVMNIKEISPTSISKQLGYCRQTVKLPTSTLREYLLLNNPEATEKKMYEIMSLVNMDEWIQKQPKGLDGSLGQAGSSLSGGEKSRVALAGALMKLWNKKTDTFEGILVLDETLDNVDPPSRAKILKALSSLFRKKSATPKEIEDLKTQEIEAQRKAQEMMEIAHLIINTVNTVIVIMIAHANAAKGSEIAHLQVQMEGGLGQVIGCTV